MAFFTATNPTVPAIPTNDSEQEDDENGVIVERL